MTFLTIGAETQQLMRDRAFEADIIMAGGFYRISAIRGVPGHSTDFIITIVGVNWDEVVTAFRAALQAAPRSIT